MPSNDNFSNATVLSGTSGTLSGQTTVGATLESGEGNILNVLGGGPCPLPASNETVWYSFIIPAVGVVVPMEMWFATDAAAVGMVLQVFYVTATGAPSSWNNLQECSYGRDNSANVNTPAPGIGYSTDAGVSVICTPGVQYYIRVASRKAGVDGAFNFIFKPYFPLSLRSCDQCPPRIGITGCLEKLVGTVQIPASYLNQHISFGNMPPGNYWARYCGGAFQAYWGPSTVGAGPGGDLPNLGYFTCNSVLVPDGFGFGIAVVPYTVFIYQNTAPVLGPAPGSSAGFSSSTVAPFGTLIFPDISTLDGSVTHYDVDAGTVITDPIQNVGSTTTTWFTSLAQAQKWSLCGKAFMTHTGGEIYVANGMMAALPPGSYGGASDSNLTGSVTWGLYQIVPTLQANGFTISETDTTTAGGTTDLDSSYVPVTPGPSVTQVTFNIQNLGELEYDNVTVTLTGVTSPSAPQVINLPTSGTTPVTFTFETPTSAVTAVLSFTDALGETFPTLSYSFEEFLIIDTPAAAAEPTCPTTITKFTFPIKNVGTVASGAATQIDVHWEGTIMGSSYIANDPGNVLGTGCTTNTTIGGASPDKTTPLGAIAPGATATAFIECENQPSGYVSIWQIQITGSGLANIPPDYYFTYTWP
jgi:hypothetical protein